MASSFLMLHARLRLAHPPPHAPLGQLPRPHDGLQVTPACTLCLRLHTVKRLPASGVLPVEGGAIAASHALLHKKQTELIMYMCKEVRIMSSAWVIEGLLTGGALNVLSLGS